MGDVEFLLRQSARYEARVCAAMSDLRDEIATLRDWQRRAVDVLDRSMPPGPSFAADWRRDRQALLKEAADERS